MERFDRVVQRQLGVVGEPSRQVVHGPGVPTGVDERRRPVGQHGVPPDPPSSGRGAAEANTLGFAQLSGQGFGAADLLRMLQLAGACGG